MKGTNPILDGMDGKVGNYVVVQKGDEVIVRKRVFRNKSKTNPQKAQRAAFSTTQQTWKTLDKPTQLGWKTLGSKMCDPEGKRTKPFLTGPQAFASINGVLQAIGADTVTVSPVAPLVPIPQLPTVTLVATRGAGPTGAFTLRLLSPEFNQIVMVFAVPFCSAGRNFFSASSFRLLETEQSLSASGTTISPSYVARFGLPSVGEQIAVKLRPVTSDGFKGITLTLTVLVTAASEAQSAGDNDETGASPLQMG